MGIDLQCCDKELSFSYSGWNVIRENIAKAFIKYLHEKVTKFIDIHDGKYTYCPLRVAEYDLTNLFAELPEDIDVNGYLFMMLNYQTQDALIFLGLIGIYHLLNKSDCDGFYSPGNSMDIVELLKNIEEYIDKETVPFDDLLDLFNTSYKNNQLIIIA
jgi:hypothetical protein